jgi:hypothetical protein
LFFYKPSGNPAGNPDPISIASKVRQSYADAGPFFGYFRRTINDCRIWFNDGGNNALILTNDFLSDKVQNVGNEQAST